MYCLDVQMQLLAASWPKEIHGLVPVTRKIRSGTRLIFRGLRVRMGIHDADPADGSLVHNTHAVTGKMTYTGAAMEIANEIGDLGEGGQIIVTERAAQWLRANDWMFTHQPFVVDPLRDHASSCTKFCRSNSPSAGKFSKRWTLLLIISPTCAALHRKRRCAMIALTSRSKSGARH